MSSDASVIVRPEMATSSPDFHFDNTYARLPDRFYSRVNPTPVAAPRLIKLNEPLARFLGLDPVALASSADIFAGNRIAEGSQPLAIAYAGHQFGHFVPQLGDGRANLLGEVVGLDGQHYDIQLKGSGLTFFSRRGDGRAALGPVLREYIVSEAMAALGVPTTRALAAITTGEEVYRETVVPGGIITRVAASHLRVGTFQYFAARGDVDGLRILANFAIARHYPDAALAAKPIRALLDGVIGRHARLVAQWMSLGFVHGVMNTDNTSISGETLDYGPCAFMEAYDPEMVFSSIDRQGRYGYANQPVAAHWNLARLAETLLPLLEEEEGSADTAMTSATDALAAFASQFEAAHTARFRRKLGLSTEEPGDTALIEDLLSRMAANHADFTLTFRRLNDAAFDSKSDAAVGRLFTDPTAYDAWAVRWRQRLTHEDHASALIVMRQANAVLIPRNHMVEALIVAAVEHEDFRPFEAMLDVIARPFDDRPDLTAYTTPARPEQVVTQTFCGT